MLWDELNLFFYYISHSVYNPTAVITNSSGFVLPRPDHFVGPSFLKKKFDHK